MSLSDGLVMANELLSFNSGRRLRWPYSAATSESSRFTLQQSQHTTADAASYGTLRQSQLQQRCGA